MMPKNGSAMMYTSGCPKNQNMCCQSMAPAVSESNTCAFIVRSRPRPNRAAARTGKTSSTRIEVMSTVHTKIDMRNIVMPGARMQTIVVTKLTAPMIEAKPVSARP